jgi:hypothetical protein
VWPIASGARARPASSCRERRQPSPPQGAGGRSPRAGGRCAAPCEPASQSPAPRAAPRGNKSTRAGGARRATLTGGWGRRGSPSSRCTPRTRRPNRSGRPSLWCRHTPRGSGSCMARRRGGPGMAWGPKRGRRRGGSRRPQASYGGPASPMRGRRCPPGGSASAAQPSGCPVRSAPASPRLLGPPPVPSSAPSPPRPATSPASPRPCFPAGNARGRKRGSGVLPACLPPLASSVCRGPRGGGGAPRWPAHLPRHPARGSQRRGPAAGPGRGSETGGRQRRGGAVCRRPARGQGCVRPWLTSPGHGAGGGACVASGALPDSPRGWAPPPGEPSHACRDGRWRSLPPEA